MKRLFFILSVVLIVSFCGLTLTGITVAYAGNVTQVDSGVSAGNTNKLFAYQHTPVTVTGTATTTTLFSAVIPGGTLGANGVIDVRFLFTAMNSTGATNTCNGNFGGTTFYLASLTSSILSLQGGFRVYNRNSLSSQVGGLLNTNWGSYGGTNSAANAVTSTINTAEDQTVTIRVTPSTETAKSVVSITRSGSTATATVTAHAYVNGNSVKILGANETEYNGTFVIANVTANTFDYTVTGTPATPATGTITSARWSVITLEAVFVEVLNP